MENTNIFAIFFTRKQSPVPHFHSCLSCLYETQHFIWYDQKNVHVSYRLRVMNKKIGGTQNISF